jgi:hypothetical protein
MFTAARTGGGGVAASVSALVAGSCTISLRSGRDGLRFGEDRLEGLFRGAGDQVAGGGFVDGASSRRSLSARRGSPTSGRFRFAWITSHEVLTWMAVWAEGLAFFADGGDAVVVRFWMAGGLTGVSDLLLVGGIHFRSVSSVAVDVQCVGHIG